MGIRNTGKGISVLERYQVTGIFFMTKNIKNAAIFHRILESIDKKRIRIYTRSV